MFYCIAFEPTATTAPRGSLGRSLWARYALLVASTFIAVFGFADTSGTERRPSGLLLVFSPEEIQAADERDRLERASRRKAGVRDVAGPRVIRGRAVA